MYSLLTQFLSTALLTRPARHSHLVTTTTTNLQLLLHNHHYYSCSEMGQENTTTAKCYNHNF